MSFSWQTFPIFILASKQIVITYLCLTLTKVTELRCSQNVTANSWCNELPDCTDTGTWFRCTIGKNVYPGSSVFYNLKCIPPQYACDGYSDCLDDSDEVGGSMTFNLYTLKYIYCPLIGYLLVVKMLQLIMVTRCLLF